MLRTVRRATPWIAALLQINASHADLHEKFVKYQKNTIKDNLPTLPLYTKVYGSIFQTAYYFIDVFLGAPEPSEYSMIIDTGSSTQGLPCSNCKSCGNQHWEQPYDLSASDFNERVPCGNCTTCRLNTDKHTLTKIASSLSQVPQNSPQFGVEASNLLLHDPAAMQCLYNVHYAEGSRLQGLFYNDVLWLNMAKVKNKKLKIEPSTPRHVSTCPKYPMQPGPSLPIIVPVGCHVEETHLFHDQKASGILGLEFWGTRGITTFPTSILNNLKTLYSSDAFSTTSCEDTPAEADKGTTFEYMFSLCLSPKGGSMSFGGDHKRYHASGSRTKQIPLLSHAWRSQSYTIGLTDIAVMRNSTLSPPLHSQAYFDLQRNASMWMNLPVNHPAKIVDKGKRVNVMPTLVDSGTTLSYFPPRLFGELLFDIENRVAINTGIRDKQKLLQATRALEKVEPASLFGSMDTPVVIRDRFMSQAEKGDSGNLEFIPVATALVSTGPKRLVRVSSVIADTKNRNLQLYIETEIVKRLPRQFGAGGIDRRRLQETSSPGWYAVLEPSADPANEPLDALVGFLDIPEKMEAAAPRALISKLDGYNNGECWWLQDPGKDLPLFPVVKYTFYPEQQVFWHPSSYMYSGSNKHFWCLADPNSEDSEAIFGSNSFIYEDVSFKTGDESNNSANSEHEMSDGRRITEYRLHESIEK